MTNLLKAQFESQITSVKDKVENRERVAQTNISNKQSFNKLEKQLLLEANSAANAWRASTEAKGILRDTQNLSADQLKDMTLAIFNSSYFDKTRQLLDKHNQIELDVSIPIKSISIGLIAQLDAALGLVGSIGYAMDIGDYGQTAAVCIGGGITEGLEFGADVGIELTFWNLSADDIQGYFNCQEAIVDDTFGVSGISYEQNESLAGISVGVDFGVNDGVDEWEYYILTIEADHYPVYQSGDADHFLILGELTCVNSNDLSMNHDEVSLTFRPDSGITYRYPEWDSYSMSEKSSDSDHTWNLGRSVKYNSNVKITLDVQADDLESQTVSLSDFNNGSTITKTFHRDGSIGNGWNEIEYTLQIHSVY